MKQETRRKRSPAPAEEAEAAEAEAAAAPANQEEEAFVPPPPPIGFRYCLHGYPCIVPYGSSPYCGARNQTSQAIPAPDAFAFYKRNEELKNRQKARAARQAAANRQTSISATKTTTTKTTTSCSSSSNLVKYVRTVLTSFKLSPPSALPYETELAVEQERMKHPPGQEPPFPIPNLSHVNPAGKLLQRAALAVRHEQQKLPRPGIARTTNFTRNEISFLGLLLIVIALIVAFFMPNVMTQRILGKLSPSLHI